MKNEYLKRIRHIILAVFLIAVVLIIIDYNFFLEYDVHENKPDIQVNQTNDTGIKKEMDNYASRTYYIVYEDCNRESVELAQNIEATLQPMKQAYKLVPIGQFNDKDIKTIDTVMLVLTKWDPYESAINQLLLKVSEGTCLFIANVPLSDSLFHNHCQKFGIYDIGTQVLSDEMTFIGNTVTGLTNETVSDPSFETSLNMLHLVKEAKVLIKGENEIPQFYTYHYGSGMIGVYTAKNLNVKRQRGLLAGMLGALDQDVVYPVVQTGVVFLDDFPSPMFGRDNKIQEEYRMDVETFVRDVWWPDVLELAKQNGIVYTAAMVADYNGLVHLPFPEDGGLQTNMIYYYGKEIIRSGGEICFHGFNHQPLQFEDYKDPMFAEEYKVWPSMKVAEQAIELGLNRFAEAFPNYVIHGYVPPSDVISEQGETIIENALKETTILCGLYMSDNQDAPEYDYEEKNRVVYFPRVESGCFLTDENKYVISTVLTHVGVFSHFIHPDDVLDEGRSHGLNWQKLRLEYENLLAFLSKKHGYLRKETLTEAGQHVADWDQLQIQTNYYADHIEVQVSNTTRPYYLMLRTNKKVVKSENYSFEKIDDTAYLIYAEQDYISIDVEERN